MRLELVGARNCVQALLKYFSAYPSVKHRDILIYRTLNCEIYFIFNVFSHSKMEHVVQGGVWETSLVECAIW